ncbi:hypothetical protein L9F63_018868, partial [Diploptera punctata]
LQYAHDETQQTWDQFQFEARDSPTKKFTCNICGASYRQGTNLTAHKKKHFGETRCHLCNKILSRKSNMERHLFTVHKVALQK